MKAIGIIPARYGSSRFPGKPLALIAGKPMIAWVYENASRAKKLNDLLVATDDERILEVVSSFGGKAIMTSSKHSTGTERVYEAASKTLYGASFDDVIVVNIQGDEPLIDPAFIDALIELFSDSSIQIATAVRKVLRSTEFHNPNEVKVVKDKNNRALYFSRSNIPFVREPEQGMLFEYWIHIGIYAYRYDVLQKLVKLEPSFLEEAEKLEQLRWLEHGFDIFTIETTYESLAVDVPADIAKIEEMINSRSHEFGKL